MKIAATARCHTCPWTAGPGDPADVDRQAEKHVKTAGHPVGTMATPARQRETA